MTNVPTPKQVTSHEQADTSKTLMTIIWKTAFTIGISVVFMKLTGMF